MPELIARATRPAVGLQRAFDERDVRGCARALNTLISDRAELTDYVGDDSLRVLLLDIIDFANVEVSEGMVLTLAGVVISILLAFLPLALTTFPKDTTWVLLAAAGLCGGVAVLAIWMAVVRNRWRNVQGAALAVLVQLGQITAPTAQLSLFEEP